MRRRTRMETQNPRNTTNKNESNLMSKRSPVPRKGTDRRHHQEPYHNECLWVLMNDGSAAGGIVVLSDVALGWEKCRCIRPRRRIAICWTGRCDC